MKRRQLSILSNASIIFALVAVWSGVVSGRAETGDTFGAREIARLDRQFSALSLEKGMPTACVSYFADDGIAFAPMAVNGKKYWSEHKEFPGTLVWKPAFAAVSSAGDLGYTTGPWELQKKNGIGSTGFGNYVTIWRKRTEWKIALDVGIDNPQPSGPPPPLQVLPPDAVAAQHSATETRRSYRKTELAFFEHARENIGKAIIDSAAPEVCILRDKSFPALGTSAAQVLLGSEHGKVVRKLAATKLSSSGDLSYTYGNYSEERGNVSDRGIYLMIWRVDLNGDWKLVLDLQKKVASAKS